jgi:hypothetical protein
LDEMMMVTVRIYCCPTLDDALARETEQAGGASLIVREERDGALYFKIATGDHEAASANVNEPVGFCPFCGLRLAGEPTGADNRLVDSYSDEELTVLASAPTLVIAGRS